MQIILPVIFWTVITAILSLILPLIIVSFLSATNTRFQTYIQKKQGAADTTFSFISFGCVVIFTILWKMVVPNDSSLHIGHFQSVMVGIASWIIAVYIVLIFEEAIYSAEKKYNQYSYN